MLERAYFFLCLAVGRLLRAGRYSNVSIISQADEVHVRKCRVGYAPLLVWVGAGLFSVWDTGVRVLSQHEWEEREHQLYQCLHGTTTRVDKGILVLPYLAGETLAHILETPHLAEAVRKRAIERAVLALADFHHLGFTHGDAMADNVLVDLDTGIAQWFDFETMHVSSRPLTWCYADDVRALLVTCLARTAPCRFGETLNLILDNYANDTITALLAIPLASAWHRALPFHLAQSPLSFQVYRQTAWLLKERLATQTIPGLADDGVGKAGS